MRTTLVSVLVILAQWGMPAHAQPQAGALPTAVPAAPNGHSTYTPTKRLFFFTPDPKNMGRPAVFGRPSDPMNVGRPAVFGRPAQALGTGGFPRSYSIINSVPRNPAHPTLRFSPTGLLPLESQPPQNLWRFLRPKNSRLFFFSKP